MVSMLSVVGMVGSGVSVEYGGSKQRVHFVHARRAAVQSSRRNRAQPSPYKAMALWGSRFRASVKVSAAR